MNTTAVRGVGRNKKKLAEIFDYIENEASIAEVSDMLASISVFVDRAAYDTDHPQARSVLISSVKALRNCSLAIETTLNIIGKDSSR